jgi:hypothetical protein
MVVKAHCDDSPDEERVGAVADLMVKVAKRAAGALLR